MTTFADSNRVGLRWVAESTWGTTPAGPAMQALNFTGESLVSTNNTVTSDTIRDDRNVSDLTIVGGGAGGDVSFELRYDDIDDLILGALNADWVEVAITSSGVASAAFATSSTIIADTNVLSAVVSGMFVRVGSATTAGNDGTYRVTNTSTVAAGRHEIHLAVASSGGAPGFSTEVFGAGTRLQGKNARNGTTRKSFTLEKAFTDVSSAFHQFSGMRVTQMDLDITSQQILTGSFGFTGKGQDVASATVASTVADPSTNTVMNASGNVGSIWEGGESQTDLIFESITLSLNNNPREQTRVGSDQLAGVGQGRCEVTGSFEAYFANNQIIDKYVAGTKTSLRFQVNDLSGNSYVFDIPKVTLTDTAITADGPNDDVMQNVSWGASVDDTNTYAFQVTALDA